MPRMQDEQFSDPALPPGLARRSFPKRFKAGAVALALDEGPSMAPVPRALRIGESSLCNWVRQARGGPRRTRGAHHDRVGRAGAVAPQGDPAAMECDLLQQTDYAKHRAHHKSGRWTPQHRLTTSALRPQPLHGSV